MPPPILLHDFLHLAPPHPMGQAAILEWLAAAHVRAEATRRGGDGAGDADWARALRRLVLRVGGSTSRIRSRGAFLDDFTHTSWERMRIYRLDRDPAGAPAEERGRAFAELAGDALDRLYPEDAGPPGTLLHVTCTGYVAPSPAQCLVARRGWGERTAVLHAYHMGCYAALPATRMAAGLLAGDPAPVDLAHTELCSLHLDPGRHDPEQLVVQALFADGVIRYRAGPGGTDRPGLEWLAGREELLPETEDAMAWAVAGAGMRMTLSRRVPELILGGLDGFLERLGAMAGRSAARLRDGALFAIHPGGPRIIDELAAHLGLAEAQVCAGNHVLAERGNMSSATLPHVWQELLEDPAVPDGAWIVALAFGPGLTLAGALLRKRA